MEVVAVADNGVVAKGVCCVVAGEAFKGGKLISGGARESIDKIDSHVVVHPATKVSPIIVDEIIQNPLIDRGARTTEWEAVNQVTGTPPKLELPASESSEESLLHSSGVNEMKGINLTSPLSGGVIMPSPTFLWRFKVKMFVLLEMSCRIGQRMLLLDMHLVLLFFIWGFCCCKIGWHSVMRMSADLRDLFLYEAFLYYNPLLLVTLMVWFWGINLWVFSQANVNYAKIFDLDQNHLTHREIWKCATWMTIIVPTSMTAYLYLYSDGEVSLAASQPVIVNHFENLLSWSSGTDFQNKLDRIAVYSHQQPIISTICKTVLLYVAALMLLISPFDIFYLSSRYYLLRTLWRIVLPLQAKITISSIRGGNSDPGLCDTFCLLRKHAITFSDFFLADILTSMSKVLSDLERSVCRMVHRQVATIAWFEADSVCGSHSVAIPVVLVLPYIFRLLQCLRQYKDTGEKSSLLNALKYSTAVPVIFLSALKYHVFPDKWTSIYRPLWLMSSLLNSMYSFYWDITRDWDMSCFTRIFKFGRPHICSYLLHGRTWVYCWVIGSNLIMRCTWTYKLSAHLRHNYLTVFAITALEIFRRFQWVFFRVENEWNKMSAKSHIQLSESDDPSEDSKLLDSGNYSV
uniref:EXS domain-containing protein n=1 Tax=Chenopodium quinoa TaxID=63459 RepID=A0A803MV69_CHEQI